MKLMKLFAFSGEIKHARYGIHHITRARVCVCKYPSKFLSFQRDLQTTKEERVTALNLATALDTPFLRIEAIEVEVIMTMMKILSL